MAQADGIRNIGILNGFFSYSKSPQKLDQTEREKLKRKGLKKVVYVRIVGMKAQLDQFATLLPRVEDFFPADKLTTTGGVWVGDCYSPTHFVDETPLELINV